MTNPNPQDYPGAPGSPNVPPSGVPGQYPPAPPPQGYQQPPPAGYQAPPPGYGPPPGQPGYGAPMQPMQPPPGYADNDEKTWALVSTFGAAGLDLISVGTGGWIAGLVAYLVKGTPTVKAHAKASLNFQIVVNAVAVVLIVLRTCSYAFFSFGAAAGIGTLLWILQVAVMAVGIVFGVLAGVKANEGTLYKYPLPITIIK